MIYRFLFLLFDQMLSFIWVSLPLVGIFHQRLLYFQSKIIFRQRPSLSMLIFNQRLSFHQCCPPSKVGFHQRSVLIEGHLTSKVVFHWNLSSIVRAVWSTGKAQPEGRLGRFQVGTGKKTALSNPLGVIVTETATRVKLCRTGISLLTVLWLTGCNLANQTQTSATRCSLVKLKEFLHSNFRFLKQGFMHWWRRWWPLNSDRWVCESGD